jgi:LPXTG-site transpeptidase (sortase) family protein
MAKIKRTKKEDEHNDQVKIGDFDNDAQAANLVRHKISRLYEDEPDAKEELAEAANTQPKTKHQQFMYDLGHSGKTIAEVQVEWHNYYTNLPDTEKHEVWQEFYDSQASVTGQSPVSPSNLASKPALLAEHKHEAARPKRTRANIDNRSPKDITKTIRDKVTANGQIKAKHNLQSLFFGLSMGSVVIIIFMFSFFNQIIITPFIRPSSVSADTPIILNGGGVAPTTTPEVIIPKINVEIPVDYSETSTSEAAIESDLEDGVVHYPTTVLPGQNGNAAFFGHSSNNIFNPGKYKFAFVLLHTLVNGDTFYLTYNDKVYVYKVISKTVVSPSDVNVLNSVPGQTATATLITCDPPGTSINRLIVVGQQISPSVSGNSAAPVTTASSSSTPTSLPGNGPSLWSRFIGSSIGKLISVIVVLAAAYFLILKLDTRFKDLKGSVRA